MYCRAEIPSKDLKLQQCEIDKKITILETQISYYNRKIEEMKLKIQGTEHEIEGTEDKIHEPELSSASLSLH